MQSESERARFVGVADEQVIDMHFGRREQMELMVLA